MSRFQWATIVAVVLFASAFSSPLWADAVLSISPLTSTTAAGGTATFDVNITGVSVAVVAIPGDLNSDGVVDCADFAIVKGSFGLKTTQPGFDPRADVNHVGIANIPDLSFVARQLPAGTACQ